jgi:2-polyprenyl-3-methyl-5-hydroxy-6-metoxy-1,4-benzoquinol methylase
LIKVKQIPLAGLGLDVTGVDSSPAAIEIAHRKTAKK